MTELVIPITNVTVYSDRAQITRSESISLTPDSQLVTIPAIARTTHIDTLQIMLPGVQIISVETQPLYEVIYNHTEKQAVEVEHAELTIELDALEIEIQLVGQRLTQLNILSTALNQTLGTALVDGHKTAQDALGLSESLQEQYRETFIHNRDLNRQRDEVQKKLDPLRKQLDQYRHQPVRERRLIAYHVQIHISVEAPIETLLTAVYFVEDVKWKADYICHLREKRVLLKYGAFIYQNTGEDWPPLQLRLSTAELGAKPQVPHIVPWKIDKLNPDARPQSQVIEDPDDYGTAYTRRIDVDEALARPRQASKPASNVTSQDQPDIEDFRTAQPIAIMSQAQFVQTLLFEVELPALYDYVSVPRVDNRVVYRAKIINASPYTLVSAPITIQENNSIVSKTTLPRTVSGENLEFALRIEDRIKVRRRLAERKHTVLEDDKRQIFCRYSIFIYNLRDNPVKITLRDAMPLPLHEDIQVQVGQIQPEPLEIAEHNILKWVLDLPAQTERELTFEFTVIAPRGLQLKGMV